VDTQVVLRSELEERIAGVSTRARAGGMALPDKKVLQDQVLEHLISEKLQLQVARRVGFTIKDAHVNQAIAQKSLPRNLQRNSNKTA